MNEINRYYVCVCVCSVWCRKQPPGTGAHSTTVTKTTTTKTDKALAAAAAAVAAAVNVHRTVGGGTPLLLATFLLYLNSGQSLNAPNFVFLLLLLIFPNRIFCRSCALQNCLNEQWDHSQQRPLNIQTSLILTHRFTFVCSCYSLHSFGWYTTLCVGLINVMLLFLLCSIFI